MNEERTMYTGKFMARCLCMVGIVDLVEVSVWYGTVITATGHIRGCGAYGDRHDTLPPGIQVYQQGTAKYGTAGYKAYQAPLHTLSPPN